MIKITGLNKRFGKKIIFKNFSYTFPGNGIVALAGGSGSGKTTLLRMISGLDKKYSGNIELTDVNKISFVFQEPRLLPDSSALENVALVLGNTEESKKTATEMLTKLDLGNDINTLPSEMSGGMKQRVSIARALCYNGDVLLLDEPFNGIDSDRTRVIMDIIKDYSKERLCILVSHNQDHIDYLNCSVLNIG